MLKNLPKFHFSKAYAIVGSGPAGLFTARTLATDYPDDHFHVYDKDLCPTGLIRYGMAPDH